ncbi:MAG: cysteine--tRNA ligase [Hyphomicrobium sp.]
MALKLYNTLTRQKAAFQPIDPKNVRMYVCGPTVYDFAHIGNARPVIVFDVLFRLLKHLYPGAGSAIDGTRVTYVRNITDVDDKINARALRDFPDFPLNDAIARVTEKTANQFHADVKALGCLAPTVEPRATDNIPQMIALIEQLLAKGHAYAAGGEVLFDVASMPDYGALSKRNLDEQQAGARVEVEAHKKNPADFVLWKLSSADEPGWESPWGLGRPGWHIECSAMSARYLGEEFDIHGGGLDLIFPHHENEIAQSRCGHGTPVMANVWMHNGFLQVEGEKMSKSLGNFVTINELFEGQGSQGRPAFEGDVLRLNMLRTHYRQPINWTRSATEESHSILGGWKELLTGLMDFQEGNREYYDSEEAASDFIDALCDDLNTPKAIAVLHGLAKNRSAFDEAYRKLFASGRLLGLWTFDSLAAKKLEEEAASVDVSSYVESRIAARREARNRKDFAESDRIRDELAKMGIALKDTKNKDTGEIETTWEVVR